MLANALLMIGAVDLGLFEESRKYQHRLHQKHGPVRWALQYQPEDRTRKEQFVRVRRDGDASYKLTLASTIQGAHLDHAFGPLQQWSYVVWEGFSENI